MIRKCEFVINGKKVKAETEGSYYCGKCGRPLTSEYSQLRGYGKCCYLRAMRVFATKYNKAIILEITP